MLPVTRVLFVCVHNAGRSQMAEAFFNRLADARGIPASAESAGTAPGLQINPAVVAAMSEIGYSLAGRVPRQLTPELAEGADRIITMGCGVEAGMCPAGTFITEDWHLQDPHGQSLESVRQVRDAVRSRVEGLVAELGMSGRVDEWTSGGTDERRMGGGRVDERMSGRVDERTSGGWTGDEG